MQDPFVGASTRGGKAAAASGRGKGGKLPQSQVPEKPPGQPLLMLLLLRQRLLPPLQ